VTRRQASAHDLGPRLRLAFLCRGGHGGSTVAALDLARGLAERGHRVEVFAPAALPDQTRAPGLRTMAGCGDGLAEALTGAGETEAFDAIHTHFATGLAGSALEAANRLRQRGQDPTTILTLHGSDLTQALKSRSSRLHLGITLDAMDQVVVVSRDLAERAQALLGEAPLTIHGGLDLDHWRPSDGPPRPELVHVSTLQPLKRVPELVAAFAAARRRGAPPALRLRIVGDGPDLGTARAVAHQLGIAAHVAFDGARPRSPATYQGARAVVSWSREEAFGLSLLEGLACGLPLVAPRLAGIEELAGLEPPGTLLEPDDSDGLASALSRVGWGSTSALRQAARRRAEQFSIQATTTSYEAVYWHKAPL